MKKKIGLFLCGLGCLISSAYTSPSNEFIPTLGMAFPIELLPNEPQSFFNPLSFTIRLNCTLISQESEIQLAFSILRKSGTINNVTVNAGDTITMSFMPNEQVELSALPGGKVELTNIGEEAVTASCYTV
jgi:hypothetical protein